MGTCGGQCWKVQDVLARCLSFLQCPRQDSDGKIAATWQNSFDPCFDAVEVPCWSRRGAELILKLFHGACVLHVMELACSTGCRIGRSTEILGPRSHSEGAIRHEGSGLQGGKLDARHRFPRYVW